MRGNIPGGKRKTKVPDHEISFVRQTTVLSSGSMDPKILAIGWLYKEIDPEFDLERRYWRERWSRRWRRPGVLPTRSLSRAKGMVACMRTHGMRRINSSRRSSRSPIGAEATSAAQ